MNKIFLSLFLLLLLQQQVFAQNKDKEVIDSLVRLVSVAKADSEQVKLYAAIMLAHVYHKPEKGIAYKEAGLALAQKTGWKWGIARIHHRAGRLYWRLGNLDEAIRHHQQALQLYKQMADVHAQGRVLIEIGQDYLDNGKLREADSAMQKALAFNEAAADFANMATAYDVICYLYEVQGNYAGATKAAFDFLRMSEKSGDTKNISHSAHMLASNYLALGNNQEALKYYRQGLVASKQTDDAIEQLNFTISIGDIYLAEKNFSEAHQYYTTGLTLAREVDDAQMLGYMYRRMGHYHRTLRHFPLALQYYQSSETAYKSISNKQDLAGLYADIGNVYISMNKLAKAKKSFDQSKDLYAGLNSKMSMADYYDGKQKLDSVTGDWQSAYRNFKEYVAITDSTNSKESLQKLVGAQFQYENETKDALVKAEQQRKDLLVKEEIKRQRNIRNAAFAVLAAVLLFSVVAIYQRNKLAKEKKRSDRLLQDKELLLREIHHRVKNNLEVVSSLLALQSAQIDDAQTKDAMQESQNRVQSIGIVHQKLYQGANLGAIEMKDYFINLSESILDSFGAEKRVTIECAMENLDVDIDTAVPLGLIVNELLTNTLKYAFPQGQPGKVLIKLQKKTEGILQLEVSDNGVGKSSITQGTGFGGQLVSLLTQQLNGSMKEEVTQGTRVYFEFRTGKAA